MPWPGSRRRTHHDVARPIPSGTSHVDAARQVVDAFLADPPRAEIERAEVVELRGDQVPATSLPAIELQWRQGRRRFGLLMPIELLAREAGDLDGVPFYLRLAVNEPHEEPPDGVRAWYTHLPSGPY